MSKEEEKIRKMLDLFERYIMAIMEAKLSDNSKALKAVREEVVALIKSEM